MIANQIILTLIEWVEKFMNFHDFITGMITLFAVTTFIYFLVLNRKMNREIIKLTKVVEQLEGTPHEKMIELNELINSKYSKEIRRVWKKYYDTLLKENGEGAGVEISSFFNRITLVDIPTKRKIAEVIPGTLIATGILGTFTGLVTGLSTMDVSGAEEMKQSMVKLMEGLKVGFLASVLAIGSSLVWNFLDRVLLHVIIRNVTEFQIVFEQAFPSESLGTYLIEMIKMQNVQTEAVKDMSSNINAAAEPKAPAPHTLDEKIYSHMTNSIKDAMGPLTEGLTELIAKISEKQEEKVDTDEKVRWHEPAIELDESFSNLGEVVNQITNYESQISMGIETLVDEAKKTNQLQYELSQVMIELTKSMGQVSEKIQHSVSSAVGSSMGQASQQMNASLNMLTKKIETSIKETVDEEVKQATIRIDETVQKMNTVVEKTSEKFGEMEETMKIIDGKLGDKVLYTKKTKHGDGEFY